MAIRKKRVAFLVLIYLPCGGVCAVTLQAGDMKKTESAKELRRKAEEKVASQPSPTGETDVKRLLHELQVHQVELEMQNEELRLANKTLQEHKTYMQYIINMTPAGYFRLDVDDCFVDVNDAWLKMHGYGSRDEIIGKHFSMLQVDRASDSALKHLEELHSGKPVPLGEFTSRHKDGSVGHHVFSAHPVLDTGRVVGFEWFIIDITERKQREEVLLEIQELFTLFMRYSPIYTFIKKIENNQSRIVQLSDNYIDLVGRPAEELRGQAMEDLFPPEFARKITADDLTVVNNGKVVEVDEDFNGRNYTSIKFPIFREGKDSLIAGFTIDITERKQAEEKLRYSEKRSLAYLEKSPACTKILDLDFNLQFMSDAGVKGLNIDNIENYYGKPYPFYFYPESFKKEMRGNLELAKETREIITQEAVVVDVDGNEIWFHSTIVPVSDDEGELDYFMVVSIDTTDRKQAEERLLENEERYRSLFSRASDGICIMSTGGKLLDVNESFAKMHGYSVQEIRHMCLKDLDTPETFHLADERIRHLLDGEVLTFEVEHYHKDGHTFRLEVSASLISSGKETFIQSFHRDISARLKEQEHRQQLEKKLHQIQRVKSIGQLAGGVAHDFNNMLGVILGHTELALRKADPSSPLISDLEEIRKAANRSADLTRQLLTFARKQVIAPKVLDLNEAVGGMLKMLQRLIGENIQLSWIPAAKLWPVEVDPSQIDQILANLCVNSRDAITGTGKISIKTDNSTLDESATNALPYDVVPGNYVQLSVSDDGCGMDKQTQAHIFEPFYTTKEVGSGTGLGLATVYGAVKQNHGFITVYSELGLGTVFNIYFPRTSKAFETKQETAEKPLLRGTETVLLVEDDEMLLHMVTSMLEESGYTVMAAATTELAQSFAREHSGPIHLLISDMIMPAMNGLELSVKLQPLRPDMKVLFLSGYTADIISSQGVIKEDIHFLQKPFSFEALTTKVREVLDDH